MTIKRPKPRHTLAKQIRAEKDPSAAIRLARAGRQETPLEIMVAKCLDALDDLQKLNAGQPTKYQEAMQAVEIWSEERAAMNEEITRLAADNRTAELCKIFLEALIAKDSGKIIEIGRAIESLRTNKDYVDRYRSFLLILKQAAVKERKRFTMREIALAVEWPDWENADGYAQLRRLCAELKFPVKKLRTNKAKNKLKSPSQNPCGLLKAVLRRSKS